ncbi:extracellular solute-binding protein [Paenibacillus sp. HJL G12]|uniref:Maltodextrin-binding protein n=1 Tax=Paenibacillus dendrobii TaxID=2691084 RepID=A0A7X3IKY8_9BACL|nr:maltose ABC transporter substrate-binding protein [Paenibacillus dendrobii]MWV45867.1 extracellular solute-binding protein [Paenibacillus dendrobii]
MKMKQVMALAATLTMAFSITACGSSSKNAEEPTSSNTNTETTAPAADNKDQTTSTDELKPEDGASLVVWESKEERAFTDEIAKQFTEKYNVPVKVEEVAAPDQVTKLTQDGPSGLAADVVMFPHDNLGKAVEAGLLLPNDVFGEETKKNNTEASVQGVTIDGTLYGYPRAAETYALFYNKSLVPDAPKTFDEVYDISKKLVDKSKKKYGIMWEVGNMYFNYPFVATGGGYIFGDNGTNKDDIGVNNEGALTGFKTYVKLKDVLPVKSGDINPDIKRGLFTTGDVAMDITGPWELANYKTALGDKLGLAPIPSMDGKPAISFSGIKAFYVNSFTKYPDAAQLYANFASSKDAQLLLNTKVGSIPTNLEALQTDQIKNDPYLSAFAEQTKNSQPMPTIPQIGNMWDPMGAALAEIWDNNKDPKATLDNAAKQIQDLNNGAGK